jgi:glutathione S-transferase
MWQRLARKEGPMSLTFYFAPQSTAAITDLVLAELGTPHERVTVDISKKDGQKPEFLELNPNGRVPMIVHDGTPIWESAAITIYLGELFGTDKKLWPAQGPKRGEAMKWVVWTNVTLGDAVYRVFRNDGDWVPPDQQNANAAKAARLEVQKLLAMVEHNLDGRVFLTGDDYTLADAHLNSFLDWLRYSKIDFSKFAKVNAWSERCAARPAYKQVNAH